jgi:hypothetical protein
MLGARKSLARVEESQRDDLSPTGFDWSMINRSERIRWSTAEDGLALLLQKVAI